MRFILFCLCFLLSVLHSKAQDRKVSMDVKKTDLSTIIKKLEEDFDIRFSYNDKHVSEEKISLSFKDKTLNEILEILNERTTLNFEKVSDRNIIIQKTVTKDFTEFDKTQILKEVVLNDFLTEGIRKKSDGSYHFSPKEIEILPGLTEPDIFQSIQLIPGVISPDETSTNLYVRGGTPDQNLVIWNGIKIYQTGHLYGTFSAFNPYIVKNITFINKGTNAKYGDRISSVIDVRTGDEITENFSGGLGSNLIDFDAYIASPVIKDKLSIEIAGRRSFSDFFASNTYNKYSEKVFQNQNSQDIFKGEDDFYYIDYSLKINGKINNRNYFNLSFINIENDLKSKLTDGDEVTYNDELETTNQGYNLNWISYLSPNLKLQSNVYFSKYALNYTHNEKSDDDDDDDERDDEYTGINNSNSVNDLGLSLNFEYNYKKNQTLQFGYQAANYNIEYILAEAQNNFEFLNNSGSLTSHSLYTSYLYKNKKLFDITGGIRLTYYTNISDFEVEPRINIFRKINRNFSIQATAERKTQAISQINQTINQNLALENQIWSLANNDQIPITISWQFTAGFIYSKNNWHLEIDAYFKEIEGLTTLNNGFIDVKEFDIKEGESKIMGSDLYIKKRINDFTTSVGYTLSSSRNNFEELNDSEKFPTNTDITHNFNWLNEYSYKDFKFAFGWRWHSGKPYSKATGIEEDESGYKHLVYDGLNAYRLSEYSRFDISGTYKFNIIEKKKIKGKIGISVLNIFNNQNILNRTYSIDHTKDEINTIDTRSIQRVANIVLRVTW